MSFVQWKFKSKIIKSLNLKLTGSFPHFVGFLHGGFVFYFTRMPDACPEDGFLDDRIFQAIEKSLERVDGTFHELAVFLRRANDEVELLVLHLRVQAAATVD